MKRDHAMRPTSILASTDTNVSLFDSIRQSDDQGGEFWSARDLQPMLGYTQWRRFEEAIDRACAAIENTGVSAGQHLYASAGKMVRVGSGALRQVADYRLTRYGCYMVAMNGDPRKPEIAAAQTYFAVKTREAEIATAPQVPQTYADALRAYADQMEAREKAQAELLAVQPKAEKAEKFLRYKGGSYLISDAFKFLKEDLAEHGISRRKDFIEALTDRCVLTRTGSAKILWPAKPYLDRFKLEHFWSDYGRKPKECTIKDEHLEWLRDMAIEGAGQAGYAA